MFFNKTKTYSVFSKSLKPEDLKNAIFLSNGFNFWAFLFSFIWALKNRLWLVSIALVFVYTIFGLVDNISIELISVLFSFWFGLEANNFKEAKLTKKGFKFQGIAIGKDKIDAMNNFFIKQSNKPVATKVNNYKFGSFLVN